MTALAERAARVTLLITIAALTVVACGALLRPGIERVAALSLAARLDVALGSSAQQVREAGSGAWLAGPSERPEAAVIRVSTPAYGSRIVLLVGIDGTGDVLGLSVEEHFETPGYLVRAVDGVSGATVTSRSLFQAVARARVRALDLLRGST